jgi:ankyrin repeat protein
VERGDGGLAGQAVELARAGDTVAVAACLEGGVPVDLANGSGGTLLMLAACHGREETVRALLSRGADPGIANAKGQAPLAGAVFTKEAGIVGALLDAGAGRYAGQPSAVEAARMLGACTFLDWSGLGPKF